MTIHFSTTMRKATRDDARDLAKLIDIAGEGIPTWLWAQSCGPDQSPLDVGADRARRETGGFSFRNACLAEQKGEVLGMVLSYPINAAPDDDPDDLPAPIAPFVALEKHSVDTWYVNALAVFAGQRGQGIGKALMMQAEQDATANGYSTMSIQVFGQNAGAVHLYQRLGYSQAHTEAVRCHPCQPYYTGDVLLLTKSLVA